MPFGVGIADLWTLFVLFLCAVIPLVILGLIVAWFYRRDRDTTPPEAAEIAGPIPAEIMERDRVRRRAARKRRGRVAAPNGSRSPE